MTRTRMLVSNCASTRFHGPAWRPGPEHGQPRKNYVKLMRRDRRTMLLGTLVGVGVACAGFGQEAKPVATLTELQKRLSEHVSQPRFGAALWGMKVVSLDTGKTVF